MITPNAFSELPVTKVKMTKPTNAATELLFISVLKTSIAKADAATASRVVASHHCNRFGIHRTSVDVGSAAPTSGRAPVDAETQAHGLRWKQPLENYHPIYTAEVHLLEQLSHVQ